MTALAQRLAELRLAFVFLTRLPIPLDEARPSTVAQAGWAFPICGAVVGLIAWLGYAVGAALALPGLICALFAIAAGVLVTGALHEDGLADFADGMGGGGDRARKLEIMRDSATGSYGVLALILVVAIKTVAIAEIGAMGMVLAALVALGAASRLAMLVAMALMPPARTDGLGKEAGAPDRWRIGVGFALTLLAAAPLGVAGIGAVIGTLTVAAIPALIAWRQIGGQTGDVLGAIQQFGELGGWMALLALTVG
ncbi:adenosylcobinamide-GDP ribazoletransferase [Dichotomicrobium thermohalophilum]|uniref:Adenosylcobinamide-GDP ribazoletransferase n=1 Tax=Dichotomicrobium thermohalophilum TaxID=933063 RepID=A0A397P985_9HYPH|nr:adenosylcobinamide-GDP ribazoletransferase [Dichotomicrobium thermohalophilum]RIA45468.1 cobalamin-5'-phosphate synthase [Dichotomicrobium thermohalophilum]